MKYRTIYIILPIALLTGCSLFFKQGIDTATTAVFHGIVPDSCDILLLNEVIDFREGNHRFPSDTWTLERIQTQSKACQASYDSINVFAFGQDSADLFMIKNYFNSDTELSTMRKYYRLRFANDTLINITPNLITSKDKYY